MAWGAETKTLTFSLTSNPGSWPTANSTTLTDYTYTLNDVDYTFGLKNVKCNSGYLMLTSTAVLGLPAIKDYKLTKVVAKNSGGCSTSTKVGISSSSSSASYISGGAIQTWSTQSSTYTYNLSVTVNNTVYYLYVTNKNAQVTEIALTYEGGASKTLSSISVKTVPSKTTYTEGEYFDPTGLVITKTYSDASTEDLAYAGHTSDFTFSPSTTTALTTSNTSITIIVGGKSTSQTIMVNPKPKYTVTLKDDNSTLTQASVGASVILPSRAGCIGYTFAGWTKSWTSEQSSWTTTAPTIIPAGSYTPAGNENLYPVYTKTEGGGGTTTKTLYFEPFTGSANSSAVQSTNVAATTDMFTDASATVWSHYSFNAGTTTSYATNLDGDAMSNNIKISKQANNSTVTMMEVTGINISNASNLSLSLYNRRSYTSATLSISYKIDNGDYTAVGGTISYNSTNDYWKLCDGLTISGTGNSLSLKIQLVVSGTTNRTMTLDDIKITGTVSNSTTSYTSVPSCAPKFKISSSLTGQGSILWSLDGEDFSSTIDDQIAGTSIFFKLQPNNGYVVDGAPTSDAVTITDFEDGTYGFDMPEKNVTVSATFSCATPTFKTNLTEQTIEKIQNLDAPTLSVEKNESWATYQWQSSANSTEWDDIANATNASYTPSVATTGTTYYRCLLKNGVSPCETFATSNVATVTVNAPSKCETPTFSLAEGTYTGAQSVSLSCQTDGATIHYTTDGTTPTTLSPTYSTPINVNQDMTIKAIAVKSGLANSEVASAAYTINYTVTFNMKGHGTAPSTITNAKYNQTITAPIEPSVTGYTFDGWYKETECTNVWNFASDKITESITLFAKWTPKTYSIIYHLNNGEWNGAEGVSSYTYGVGVTLPTNVQRASYEFDGWFNNESCTGSASTEITSDMHENKEYWAKWTAIYSVTFKNNGEPLTGDKFTKNIRSGEQIGTLPTLDASVSCDPHSKTFVGWMIGTIDGKQQSAPAMVSASTPVTEPMTLNAVWAMKEGSENQYKRVKQLSELVAGTKIVIIDDHNSKIFKNDLSSADAPIESNNLITITPSTDTWTLGGNSTDGWTLSNSSGKLGIATLPTSSSSNKSKPISITNTNSTWTIGASTITNCFYIRSKGHDAGLELSNGSWIAYYNNDESNMASSTWFSERLYIPSLSYSNYLTTCSSDPLIEVSTESLTGFSTIATTNEPSDAKSFMVEGYNLTENITVSAPTGYEVSTPEAGSYASSLTLTATNGIVNKTTVYVRLAAAAEANDNVTGDITLASSNTEQTIALTGKIIAKTLNSISVATAPTKTTYTIGEKFNPAGLVITATYNSGDETVSYADHESEFSFSPALDAELTSSNTSVQITWGEQNINQALTLQCSVAWKVNSQDWTEGTPTTSVNLNNPITAMPDAPTSEACNGKTFMGWSAKTVDKTDDKPALMTKVADFGNLTANTTYHAVFASASEGGAEPTAYTAGDEGTFVLAAYNTKESKWYALPTNPTVSSGKIDGVEITVSQTSSSVNYVATADASGYTWTIANATNGQTISDGSKYIYHSNGGSSGTNLTYGTSTSYTWKIESGTNGLTFKGMSGSTVGDRGMLVSKTQFGGYSLTNEDKEDYYRIQVLPIDGGISYSEYSTTCTPVYDVNFYTDKSKDAATLVETKKVEENSKATAPATDPTKAGATFDGWFTANDEALADKTITEATDFIAKWNYTAPTITTQPQGDEYTIGVSVNLLVIAEPIEGVTFTYQWQRLNGSTYEDIAGATNNYYTAPTTEESVNTYRCVVTNGDASTTSNPATVSVHPASYCAMPTIRIDELGEALAFIREATVTMECGNDGAIIYYTTDGSNPKEVGATPNTYSVPFTIDATKTIKAFATATDLEPSSVQEKTFTKATLQSIAVKTAPITTTYTALTNFNPAGLVITAAYNPELSEEIDYANHSGEFTFTPALTTELGVDVEAVQIGWGGKETEQQITVDCIAMDVPAVETSKQGSTGITLTWSAIDNAASYQVKWNGVEVETPTYNTELSKYEFVKSGLTANTSYTYEVIAIGETNYCNSTTGEKSITTNKKSCESITNPSIVKEPTEFYVGESIDHSQFEVDKHYDNGDVVREAPSKAEIEGVTNPLTDAEVGTQIVTLTFNNKTTTIKITVKPQPVVTWSINGNEDNKQSFAYNADLVLPEAPAAPQSCAEKKFVGWTTEAYKDHDEDTAPGVLFTKAGDRKVTEDVTYYAVFAMVENAEINTVLTEVFDDNQTTDSNSEFDKNTFSNFNGNCSKAYKSQYGGVKLGSSSAIGYITSKELNLSKPTTITFDVKQYDDDEKAITATIINSENQTESVSKSYSCTTENSETAVLNFESSYAKALVKFTTTSSSHRIYFDNVKIEAGGELISSAYSTKCAARTPKSIEITAEATTKTFDVDDPFTYEGLEITASYNTGDPQVVTGYCTITEPDMTTAGENKEVIISYTENDVTVYTSYNIDVRQPYYVTYDANGATSGTTPTDANKYYTGEKVTVLANESLVKTNNVFKGWSYDGTTYQANEQVTVGTENITLTAVWEEKMPCTITLSENGNISTVTDKSTGDAYTLPTTITTAVTGYAFMGWSTQELDEPVATTEPGTFFAKGEQMTLTESAYTFYAVYARTSGTSSDYNAGKVTTDADIVAGGLYIIEQAGHVLSSPASDKKAPTEATYKTSGLSTTESYVWTLETSTNGFYLKNMSDDNYLKANSDGDMSSAKTGPSEWMFAFQTAGYWKIYAYSSNRFLGFNSANTYLYKAYGSGNYDLTKVNVQFAAQINIYRLVGGYTTAPTIVVNGKTVMDVPTDFHGNVIVEEVGDVTLDAATTWKNLTIKNGAKVTTNAALSVKDLIIETKMGAGTGKTNSSNKKGACGQLIIGDGGSVTASETAIVENQIDPTGEASYGWYTFSVPFPVDALNGIYDTKGNKLTNEYDYAIMDYHGDLRADGQYGWKKYRGILQPGILYIITVGDTDYGTLRFKKTSDGNVVASNQIQTMLYGDAESEETKGDANWNAIGNPNLAIAQFVNNSGANTLQLYDHTTNAFTGYAKGSLNIVVGSGFFIQAVGEHPSITMKVEETDGRGYRAPAREVEQEEPFIAVQLLQGEAMNDQVFIHAGENATATYQIGRDVAKAFMSGEAKCAQLYVPAYGTKLCAADFQLNSNDEAIFPLTITAPTAGTYTLSVERAQEGATLYLMQNGAVIWNLSNADFDIDLTKGTNTEYSLLLMAAPKTTPTGWQEVRGAADATEKFIFREKLYLLRKGMLYDATGKKIK